MYNYLLLFVVDFLTKQISACQLIDIFLF